MKIRHSRCFLAVAEKLHSVRAAAWLHINKQRQLYLHSQ